MEGQREMIFFVSPLNSNPLPVRATWNAKVTVYISCFHNGGVLFIARPQLHACLSTSPQNLISLHLKI